MKPPRREMRRLAWALLITTAAAATDRLPPVTAAARDRPPPVSPGPVIIVKADAEKCYAKYAEERPQKYAVRLYDADMKKLEESGTMIDAHWDQLRDWAAEFIEDSQSSDAAGALATTGMFAMLTALALL